MKTKEKSKRIIDISGKTEDWKGWSEKFFARGRWNVYHILLIGVTEYWKGWSEIFLVSGRWNGYHILLIGVDQKERVDKCQQKKIR